MAEFARWKVRNTAIERRDLIRNPVPLMPDFQRSVRLLGRRPSTQQFIDTIIKKYGTHILISATLGGEEALTMYMAKNKLDRKLVNATQNVEALHQLASSYFIDRDGTMRKLHEIQISTNAIKADEEVLAERTLDSRKSSMTKATIILILSSVARVVR
ncbi:unnamed protein product [Coregonus sp. 'balchen']|nr:unnamed protein product [Coregonus sp. 'balchen']